MFGLRKDSRRERLAVLAAFHKQESDKLASEGGVLWCIHSDAYWRLTELAKAKRLDDALAHEVNEYEDWAIAWLYDGAYALCMSLARELSALL